MHDHDEQSEQDELWELLGKAKKPSVSMKFTQNVLRAVEQEQDRPRWSWEWLRKALAPATVAFASLTLLGIYWMSQSEPVIGSSDEVAFEEIVNMDQAETEADFAIIDDLDVLLASEDSQVWLDDSPRF